MKRLINWLTSRFSSRKASPRPELNQTGSYLRETGSHARARHFTPKQAVPRRQAEFVKLETHVDGSIREAGPGKNVLVRNRFVREDTGTHETLRILDDASIETREETGIDPYNTGQFDRSRNWERHLK
ncbi:MAG: hypothetical protein WB812_04110 [Woeseiaceae bacterium]